MIAFVIKTFGYLAKSHTLLEKHRLAILRAILLSHPLPPHVGK